MNIRDLEEFEGITEAVISEWLTRNDWTCRGGTWRNPGGAVIADPQDSGRLLELIANLCCDNVQSLLREMSPRMMRRTPTPAELAAHDGYWIAQEDGFRPIFVDGRKGFALPPFPGAKWSFWPCDAHGNKVPYPKVAK